MNKKVLVTIFAFLAIFWLANRPALAIQTAGSSAVLRSELPPTDPRLAKLEGFLESYRSPLVDYSDELIGAADRYQIDWRLVPAITGVESSFGRQIPFNSCNAYGWANGKYRFESWEESIDQVSRALREKYYDRGLDNPFKIGPVYAPPSPTWASRVAYLMARLECFGDELCLENLDLTL